MNTLEDLAHASIDAGKLEDANGYLQQLGLLLSANSNRLDALYVTLGAGQNRSGEPPRKRCGSTLPHCRERPGKPDLDAAGGGA